ncbi:hypothetical protein DFH09DRAFT_1091154 [Mycena vulgaris]|nr:hypothetical protein DFH09DRAFT_1091154 [Mycena vulgaris]
MMEEWGRSPQGYLEPTVKQSIQSELRVGLPRRPVGKNGVYSMSSQKTPSRTPSNPDPKSSRDRPVLFTSGFSPRGEDRENGVGRNPGSSAVAVVTSKSSVETRIPSPQATSESFSLQVSPRGGEDRENGVGGNPVYHIVGCGCATERCGYNCNYKDSRINEEADKYWEQQGCSIYPRKLELGYGTLKNRPEVLELAELPSGIHRKAWQVLEQRHAPGGEAIEGHSSPSTEDLLAAPRQCVLGVSQLVLQQVDGQLPSRDRVGGAWVHLAAECDEGCYGRQGSDSRSRRSYGSTSDVESSTWWQQYRWRHAQRNMRRAACEGWEEVIQDLQ